MNACIGRHRDIYGAEPICKVLQIASSMYGRHAARVRCPQPRSACIKRDELLVADIQRVWQDNMQIYGVRKIWCQPSLQGARRGKAVCTTIAEQKTVCPPYRGLAAP